MEALVTGANGFVGTFLTRHLSEMGDVPVSIDPAVDVSRVDSVLDYFDAIDDIKIEVVYHLAGLAHVQSSFSSSSDVLKVNTIGTANVLEAARRVFPDARVVVVSSSEVYGMVLPELLPITEEAPTAPLSPYGVSKLAAEQATLQAFRAYHQDVVIARPFNHIGPGQSDSYVVSALARRVLEAKREGVNSISVGNLKAKRDFTDVRDVVRAYRLLADKGRAGAIYNICSGVALPIEMIANRLVALAGADLVFNPEPSLTRDIEISELRGDYSRCRTEFSWEPSISLEKSLSDVLSWWSGRLGID